MSAPALLAADAARVAVDGVTATGALTFTTAGDRALFVGDTAAFFAALGGVPFGARAPVLAGRSSDPRWVPASPGPELDPDAPRGEARVVSGSLRLLGREVARGDHLASVGVAAADVPLPPRWTPVEYVAWSARLGGARARAAADLARAALARVGLERAHQRLLSTFVLPERRALALAAAVVLSPAALVVEAPLAGLEGPAAAFVLAALAAATDGRAALVSAARIHPGTPEAALAAGATFLAVLAGGELVAAGEPAALFAGARTYAVTVRTNADALRDELRARGLDLVGAPPRCTIALPEGATTTDVLAAAAAAKAALVELAPLV
jgi:ABC-2 type transport system ATP-binding protein